MVKGRLKRGLVGAVGALACGLAVAPSALASTVTVTGGDRIRVAETGNEVNRIAVTYDDGTDTYTVTDGAANLTPSGTCVAVDAHTATCPGTGIKTISVDTGARDDLIALDPATIPTTVTEDLDGGSGNDRLIGAKGPGTLSGGSGNDSLTGQGTLNGNNGNDTITGTPAAETIRGGGGRDAMDGGDGPDDIAGGGKTDVLLYPASRQTPINVSVGSGNGNDGGAEDQGPGGRDTVHGDIEVVVGTVAGDVLIGDNSSETLVGFAGDDLLIGGGGNDTLLGFDGNDLLIGKAGNDTLRGGPGADRLFGKSGNDRLAAGSDNDFLRGGSGVDVMKGKNGIDRINAHDGIRDVKINCGRGSNKLERAKWDKGLDPHPRSC